jgi:flagellar biosynthesis/type III secretory pathway protein FliH
MQYESMRKEMRQAAVELAVAVAGRLLHDKARTGEFPLEELIRNVVEKLPDRRDVIVSMHPDDLSLLRQRLGVEHLLAEESTTQFRADAGLTRGACRAEASGVTVLSDLEIQLAILRQEMLENVAHARPKPD